ncbi:cytochrome c oxidase assembly factor 6 homolog [Prorops nasuta]|uniref:cytochrome c oxidase assembly factor 6 homolog n=1 Tax=Prorops nasuta TaxID=863751 RepID=UPI0034CDB6CF
MSFINKEARLKCWNYRDEYWKCLDQGKTDSDCKEFRNQYEKFCPGQWVKHFDRKRDYLKFKEQIEAGKYENEKNSSMSKNTAYDLSAKNESLDD